MATLLFDLDGTLLDVRRRHFAVYSHVLRELGQPPLPEAEYWRRRRDGEGTLSIVGDLPADLVFRIHSAWLEGIEAPRYLALDRPYAEVRSVLTELQRDHRLVLVTLRRDAVSLAWQLSESRLAPSSRNSLAVALHTIAQVRASAGLVPDGRDVGHRRQRGRHRTGLRPRRKVHLPQRWRALDGFPARTRRKGDRGVSA